MTEDELRARLIDARWEAAALHDYSGLTISAQATLDVCAAVERVLDLCVEYEASNDDYDGFPDVDVDVRLVRAALYGTTPGTTQETP